MKSVIDVYIKLDEGGRIPEYASEHAAGCDLYAAEDMVLLPGETKVLPLNFSMAMDPDVEAQIRPRSGLSLKTDIRLPNSPGTIDSDYRDTVGVIMQNTYDPASLPYQIIKDSGILEMLQREYRAITLQEYMTSYKAEKLPGNVPEELLKHILYIDENGYPFGTVHIKKGERIAQMIFSRYQRARFIPHPDPRSIGNDRGGGFGHSGR